MRTCYPMHRKLIHVAVLGALAATATPASALDFVWNGGTANWSPGTWSQAGLPGAADNVFIDNGNLTNSVVSLNVGATINDLNISSGDSLGVNNNQSLTTLGNVSNNGNLGLNSVGNTTDLRIGSTTTFSGTGTLTLSNHAQNRIFGNSGSTTEVLTNASGHTIQGAGQLGVNQMGLSNQGLVVANQSNALTIDLSDGAGITRTNTGTLRAAGGQLTITGSNLNNAGGVIDAVGTNVVINASTITNGTLQSSGGGKILVQGSSNLSNVSNSGQTEIANAQAGVLTGTFTNTGNLQMASAGNQTDLRLNGDVTLAGAGTLTMSNNAQNRIIGNSGATTEVLTNASGHTIQGAGQLGANQLGLNNQGLILANGLAGLVIDVSPTGMTNSGTLRAGTGVLTIQNSTVTNTPSGVLDAAGNDIIVSGSTINGTVQGSGGNKIFFQNSSNLVDVTNSTQLEIANAQTALLTGTFTNSGNLQLASVGNQTNLRLNGDVTLTGPGTLTMSNNAQNQVFGHSGSTTEILTNALGHTIQGAGQLGANQMGLDNQGLILATGSAGLVIDVSPAGMTNSGTLRAGTGVLTIQNSTVTSTPSGVLDAVGNDIIVTGSTINGTVQGSGGNKIFLENSSNLLDVTNSTLLEIANAQTGLLTGTFTNSGNLQLASVGNQTNLRLNGDVTLTGPGTLTMSNNIQNRIVGHSGSTTEILTNALGHTIQGAGQLGANQMGLDNQGLILATGSAGLVIDVSPAGMTNSGTLRAGTGVLTIQNSTVTSTPSGVLDAVGNDIIVTGSTINGTVQGSGGNKIFLQNSSNLLDVTNSTLLEIANAQTAVLTGTFNNSGNLQMASVGNQTDLRLNGDVTLTGPGTLTMSNNIQNRIVGHSGATTEVLTNASGHTIQGSGQVGANQMGLDNQGLIVANQAAALTIDLSDGAGITRTNTGILRAAGGQLTIQGSNLTNTGGVIDAAGSSVLITGSSTITGGTLQSSGGGKVFVQGSANLANVRNTGQAEIVNAQASLLTGTFTNDGNLQLSSAGNQTDVRLNGNVTLAGAGTLTMSNNGQNRILGNSGATTEVLTNAASHTIQGSGQVGAGQTGLINQGLILANQSTALTVDTSVAGGGLINNGTMRAQNGTLTINDALTGSGTLQVEPASVMNLANVANAQGRLVMGAAGSTLNIGNQNLTINNDYTNVAAAAGNAFNRRAGISGTGQILAGGDVVQAITGTTVTDGTTANATLTINNVRVGDTTFNYQIANTGTTGPTLRGAVQTSVNGANLSDARLSGAGVTAGNYNTGAPGSSTADLGVTFSAASAGALAPLSGQVLNLRSNFANIADQKLNIVLASSAAAYNAAIGSAGSPVLVANQRVGGSNTATVTVSNTAAAGSFSEDLNVSIGGASGAASGSGSIAGRLAATSNTGTGAITARVDTTSAGAKTGNLTLDYQTAGAVAGVSNGLGTASVGNQVVTVSGDVYRLAQGAATPTPIVFANRHVDDSASQLLTVQNTATADGFSEKLNASISSNGAPVTASGNFNLLAAQDSNTTALQVGIDTSSAGARSGSATISYASDGTGTSGLVAIAAGSQTINVSGDVYRLASANNLGTISFGNVHVGTVVEQALSISNTAASDGFSEKLTASFGDTSDARITTSGGVSLLAAGSTDNSSMIVGLNTSAAGNVSGTQVINFASDGTGTSGLGITALASQTIGVSGDITTSGSVFRLASASPATPNPVNFGALRINSTAEQTLSITNTATDDGFSEKLNASISSNAAPVTASGAFNLLAAQATNGSALRVGIDTSSAGAKSGSATIALVSDGDGTSDLGTTNLAPQTVNVSGDVYRLANPTLNTTDVTLVARRGDADPSAAISVTNSSPDSFTEGLQAGFASATPATGFGASGSITNLAAQGTDASSLQIALNTSSAGSVAGSAQVNFVSTGAGTTGAADISVGSQVVSLAGKVYEKAVAQVNTALVNFGIVHKGDVVTAKNVSVTNSAPVAALNDTLQGSFINMPVGPFGGSGSVNGLAAGQTDASSLLVSLDTTSAGVFTQGGDRLQFASHNEDMADLGLGNSALTLQAQVNNYADPNFSKTSGTGSLSGGGFDFLLDFGTLTEGSGMVSALLQLANDVSGPADLLDGAYSFALNEFLKTGFDAFSGLGAGDSQSGLRISLDTRSIGSFSDTIVLAAVGHNGSGYSADFKDIRLTVQARVEAGGSEVPEPGTLLLLTIAMAIIVLQRRRGMLD
ncbi:MAG: choice-of-anchor D domain-containing protein [Candidatus Accumulibacter delftensis]|jgi:hypothetical protein